MPIISATTVSTTSTYRPRIAGVLSQYVARAIGGELEPPVLTAALEYLNQAIIEFNSKLYECNKVFRSTITCTGGVGTLPTQFYKELECALVDVDGNRIRQLTYLDWAEHEQTFNYSQQSTGSYGGPYYYTLFNVYGEGKIRLLPYVSTSTVVNYAAISYYKRFPVLLSTDDVLDAPQEIERALLLKAQSDMLRIHNPSSPALQMTAALAAQAWEAFGVIDRKHPDMKPRFRLAPLSARGWTPQGDGVVYIKI